MLTIEDYEIVIVPAQEKDEHWLYLRFPDIPEILTGHSIDEAIKNAKEAFDCHREALQKQGKELPDPKKHTRSHRAQRLLKEWAAFYQKELLDKMIPYFRNLTEAITCAILLVG